MSYCHIQFLLWVYVFLQCVAVTHAYHLTPHRHLCTSRSIRTRKPFIAKSIENAIENSEVDSEKSIEKLSMKSLLLMFAPVGLGQVDEDRYKNIDGNREVSHVFMWTHLFLVAAAMVSIWKHIYDLASILVVVTPLSYLYHLTYEQPGKIAMWEGFFAKLLFCYGFYQIFQAPTTTLLITEVFLCIVTLSTFLVTNIRKNLYDPFHIFLHIVPSVWSIIVALNHSPILY